MDKAKILRLCNEINDKIVEFWNCEQIEHDDAQHIISLLDLIGFEVCAKPKSNADRIRHMTDEELAEFIDTVTDCCSDGWMCDKCPIKSIGCDKDSFIGWLKQEVSEDAGTD